MVAAFSPVVSKVYGGNKGAESDPYPSLSYFHVLGEQGQELSFDIEGHPCPPGVASETREGTLILIWG